TGPLNAARVAHASVAKRDVSFQKMPISPCLVPPGILRPSEAKSVAVVFLAFLAPPGLLIVCDPAASDEPSERSPPRKTTQLGGQIPPLRNVPELRLVADVGGTLQ